MVDVGTGTTYRLVSDQLGSVVMVVDVADGAVAQELSYDSWGRVQEDTAPGFQPFGFAGGIYDRDTGWVLFGARDYRPEVGAWAAKDPLGFAAGDSNLYRYVLGDPVNLVDPTGEDAWGDASNFSAGVGDTLTGIPFTDTSLTQVYRQMLGVDDIVDPCSAAYSAGEWAGIAIDVAIGAAEIRAGFRALKGACFEAGTLVETEGGLRPIEEVKIGDLVWARDEATGTASWEPVVQVFITADRETLELAFEAEDGTSQLLVVTPEHPLWSLDDNTWDEAGHLSLGERVETLDGPIWLVGASALGARRPVYNLDVAKSHTYFVGDPGVWAHNSCGVSPYDLVATHGLTGSRTAMRKLMNSLQENGMRETVKFVIHNGKKYIVDGHHRVMAAKRLGVDSVPAEAVDLPYSGYKTIADLAWSEF